MALSDESTGVIMPVQPMNGGFGGFGGDWAWVILLLVLFGGGGWGNNGGNNMYPWMNQADITTSGFQNAALNGNITGIQGGIAGLQNSICNGFSQAEIAANLDEKSEG